MNTTLKIINSSQLGDAVDVEKLLKQDVSPNCQNSEGVTPLQIAATNGWENIISLLLSFGADVDLPNKYGWTPLMHAARHGHTTAISILLKNKAKVNVCNKLGLTPIVAAAWSGQLSAVKILLEAGAVLDRDTLPGSGGSECDLTSLMAAALQGHDPVLRFLLDKGTSVNHASSITGLTPLMMAASNGHKQTVQIIVEWGGDANKTNICDKTALDIATAKSKREVIAYLDNRTITKPANGDIKEAEILQAARNGDIYLVKLLLQQDPSCCNRIDPQDGSTPLMLASMLGYFDIVHLLISSGAHLDAQDLTNGWTALMQAVFYRQILIVQYLLDKGANVHMQANNGYTVLDLACLLDDPDCHVVNILAGKEDPVEDLYKSHSVTSTRTLPTVSKMRKFPNDHRFLDKFSPKASHQHTRLKGWIDGVTHHLKFAKQLLKSTDVPKAIPKIQLPDQTLSPEGNVFTTEDNAQNATKLQRTRLSLSSLSSPNKLLSGCLRKHSMEAVIPPLLSSPVSDMDKERKYPRRKSSQDRSHESSSPVVALQPTKLLLNYKSKNAKNLTSTHQFSVPHSSNQSLSKSGFSQQETEDGNILQSQICPLRNNVKYSPSCSAERMYEPSSKNSFSTTAIIHKMDCSTAQSVIKQEENTDDLSSLLEQISLQKYTQRFKDQEVDIEAFQYLTEEDLKEIGIHSTLPRQKLLEIIKDFQNVIPEDFI